MGRASPDRVRDMSNMIHFTMQYTEIFSGVILENFIRKTLFSIQILKTKIVGPRVPTILCFRPKVREVVYPCIPPFYYVQVGV